MSRPIRAAGGVLWRIESSGEGDAHVQVAVIHRPRYDDWSLPKGKLAPSESELEGAVREVREETGYRVRVGRPLGETRYLKRSAGQVRPKVVNWWAMEAAGGAFASSREVDDLRWLSLAEADAILSRGSDRTILEAFARGPAPTRTILLVRHAQAGTRAAWQGDDRLRELDPCGRAQADELVRTLARFSAGEILSADVTRCRQTVEPLAEALGIPIVDEPLISETGYPGREDEALALVRSRGRDGLDCVLCSQGDVIPDILSRLSVEDGYSLSRPGRARKGSIWALTLDAGDRLVAADHLPPPPVEPCGSETSTEGA